jgi:hypothetical protein
MGGWLCKFPKDCHDEMFSGVSVSQSAVKVELSL